MNTAHSTLQQDQAARLRRAMIGSGAQGQSNTVAAASGPALPLRVHKRARVITIASGKGGVGKTSIAVNLAIALQARGVRTTLIDLDLGLANADLLCGLNPAARLDQLVTSEATLDQLSVLAPGGFNLVPGTVGLRPKGHEGFADLITRLPELDADADCLILDTGAGMGSMVRNALRVADLPLLVATPEPTSIADAYALFKIACADASARSVTQQAGPGLIVNQCASAEEARDVHHRLSAVAARFLARDFNLLAALPCDPALPRAVRDRRPLMLSSPDSPAAAAIVGAAQATITRLNLESTPPTLPSSSTLWQRLSGLIAARLG